MSTVGILGLGLIGGSFAKAYHAAGWTVLAADRDAAILSFAQMSGAVDGTLGAENAAQCDLMHLSGGGHCGADRAGAAHWRKARRHRLLRHKARRL